MRAQLLVAILHFAQAFVATLVAARLLEPLARRIGWVDRPRGRKAHVSTVPLAGGLAIAFGVAVVPFADPSIAPALHGLGAGAAILLAAGIVDDFLDLPWTLRLGLQALAVLAMIHFGDVRVSHIGLPGEAALLDLRGMSVPFSVLAGIGVINAFNMVDGGDGIAASIALAALALFGIAGVAAGNADAAQAIVVLAGAVGGFFALNMRFPWQPQARLFLGDAGSSLVGLGVVWVALRTTQTPAFPVDSALAPWFVAPPLVDCAATVLRRLRQRRSPFRADRDHLHHLLLDAGLPPARVACLLGGLTLLGGSIALIASRLGAPPIALVAAFAALATVHVALTCDRDRFVARLRRLHRREDPIESAAR